MMRGRPMSWLLPRIASIATIAALAAAAFGGCSSSSASSTSSTGGAGAGGGGTGDGGAGAGGAGGMGGAGGTGGEGGHVPACGLDYLGDPTKPIEIELIALEAGEVSAPLEDGGPIALIDPPQGGRVIFAGIRATNLDPCHVLLDGSVADPDTGEKRAFEKRFTELDPTGDGWGQSRDGDIATFANITMCPAAWAEVDVYGSPLDLTVAVTDVQGRQASKKVRVVPECAEPDKLAECLCICAADYMPGECSGAGGGGSGGGGGRHP